MCASTCRCVYMASLQHYIRLQVCMYVHVYGCGKIALDKFSYFTLNKLNKLIYECTMGSKFS